MCQPILAEKLNFIWVCKPDSQKNLYEWLESLPITGHLNTVETKHRNGKTTTTYTYRFANNVPRQNGDDALEVGKLVRTYHD